MLNNSVIDTITVIDFETASSSYSSACAIGIAVIKDKQIIDKQYYLIKPPENLYDSRNIAIHGITPDQTANIDTFPAVWEKIRHYFVHTYIAAHNAAFDVAVLKATLFFYDLEQPNFYYMDTRRVSGLCIPQNSNIGASLAERCAYYNIPLCNHHNALCDAEAAAQLVIYQLEHSRYKSIHTFVNYCVQLHDYFDVKLKKSYGSSSFAGKKVNIDELTTSVTVNEEADEDFKGKTFVFTGEFQKYTREQASAIVIARGGSVKNGVSKKVDFLVNAENIESSKVEKARELQSEGHHIKIITEEQFLRMLESNDAIDID